MYSITFEERPKIRVAVVPHQGAYNTIGAAFDKLNAATLVTKAADWENGMFGIYYSNPLETEEKDLQSAAAIALKDGMEIDGLETREIVGGRYAMMEVKGPYHQLPQAWDWLYREGVGSGEIVPRHEPAIEIYLNTPADTSPEQLLTIIAMPVL